MELNDLIRLFDAKKKGNNQWSAHCPCHDDRKESLSIGVGRNNDKLLLKCQAGCDNKDILHFVGLDFKDLYFNEPHKQTTYKADKCQEYKGKEIYSFDYNKIVDTYYYNNGTRKLRDKNKNFLWQHLENNQWKNGRGKAQHTLYIQGTKSNTLYIVEGEKDVNTISRMGLYGASSEHGASKSDDVKWYDEYNQHISSLDLQHIYIIPDNDDVGRIFANKVAELLSKSVSPTNISVIDLKLVWDDIQVHNDVSDMVVKFGLDVAKNKLRDAISSTHNANNWILKEIQKLTPESNQRYKKGDIGNGNLFADVFKNVARYSPERGRWYVYNGKYWKADADGEQSMQLCKKLADSLLQYSIQIADEQTRCDYLKYIPKWQLRTQRKTILADAQDVYPIYMEQFDSNPYIFNCLNGTLNLKTMEFSKHNPSDLLSKISGVEYNPNTNCERWAKFISEIMSDDIEKANYLKKALGYSLTGDCKEECFFILYGATSRNGKGTCMETYKRIMGDYGRATSPETISQKDRSDGSKPSEDVARLKGARFVNISEPDKNMVLSSALIKTLTGNDTIAARFLHENSFEFIPQFKIFINTNHLPTVTDASVFSSDRIKVIPFEKHFGEDERDTNLKRLFADSQNLSGILNWCIEGLKEYQSSGLAVPNSVDKATEQYKQDSDKIFKFISEVMEKDTQAEIKSSDAYEYYKNWCIKNGYAVPSNKTFTQDMKTHVHVETNKRPKAGGNPTTIINGYRIRCQNNYSVYVS